ncbi:MAG: hypothetical protein LBS67_06285 [Clostridiales Family XIII bacterium]|jgi:hypothetical protein|nr:hypothetical protein [Clostridiales Family XIII bacterium]
MTENRTGYSEALGGYGVPSQVKITGDSASKSGGDARSRKSWNFSTRNKVILAAAAVVVVVVVLWATGVVGVNQYASSISSIDKEAQSVNGASVTNYLPILAEDVVWADISDQKRAGIAKYAVGRALEQAEADQAGIFNIQGMSHAKDEAVFLYTSDGTVQVRVGGAITETIPIE